MVLDKQQQAIVDSDAPNIVVIAGAGSGKTRVLIERIRRLLLDGVDPKSIVAITFTNMAAEELTQRLSDIEGYNQMFVGTIHSFANKILSKVYNVNYQLLTDEAETYIVKELCKIKNFPITYDIYLDYKSQHYNNGEVYDYITEKYGFNISKALRHILEFDATIEFPSTVSEYAYCHNYITFDELIIMCSEYLEKENIIIDYLFVDEFQDIGSLEYKFIQHLYANHNFVVGDDYQAIYGFKGATDWYFKRLTTSDKWKTYYLENNYRCGEHIIRYANGVIQNILDANEALKASVCKSNSKGNLKFINNVASIIPVLKHQDTYSDWFLLCRTNKEIDLLVEKLNENGVPCTTFRKSDMTLDELKSLLTDNKVKVLTVHSAKGLESKNVAVLYTNPIYVPWNYDKEGELKDKAIDEIKLYYVATTRAIENLYLVR